MMSLGHPKKFLGLDCTGQLRRTMVLASFAVACEIQRSVLFPYLGKSRGVKDLYIPLKGTVFKMDKTMQGAVEE